MDRSSKAVVGGGLLVVLFAIFSGLIGVPLSSDNSCPPSLHVSNAGAEETSTGVDYENLSERRQSEFRDALQSSYTEIDTTADAWVNTSRVTYDGETYSTAVAVC
ncbi:hypothetical protein [Halococcoides cellulosivorans]|uniref:DUF7979 domain-containing protein n=1 Tax=Halococcoides cellulosivorans TaxID=1679096 RepID=A0A2R4X366_9EURY|nr:hypothetical protein [Halococcoides cellulosivorans]AWB28240.1 hypothetical protein HARCEL1_11270 [Halococcoides cellulosivorans]